MTMVSHRHILLTLHLWLLAIDSGVLEEEKKCIRQYIALNYCFPTLEQVIYEMNQMVHEMKIDLHIVDPSTFPQGFGTPNLQLPRLLRLSINVP